MSDPTVSVILPAYNAEAYIAEAVQSVRTQTYTDYEVIAVDDGSDDRTGEILDQIAAAWPKLTVIHQENQGLAKARNNAIAQMKGRYIALLDADDIWLADKLQRCMDFLADHPDISIVYTPMNPVTTDGTRMKGHSKPCCAGWLAEKLFMSIFVHDPATVFDKRVIETCGGFDETIPVSIGNEFWLRVSPHFEFGLIDEPLALRRWSQHSLTRANRLAGRKIKAAMLEKFYFDGGGLDLVPKRKAMRRLAKVNYHAGKILLQQFQCRQAVGYLYKAVRYRPAYLKVYPLLLAATLGALVR
jgi:glycosyltransferase involved in cell wall biosynthesis